MHFSHDHTVHLLRAASTCHCWATIPSLAFAEAIVPFLGITVPGKYRIAPFLLRALCGAWAHFAKAVAAMADGLCTSRMRRPVGNANFHGSMAPSIPLHSPHS